MVKRRFSHDLNLVWEQTKYPVLVANEQLQKPLQEIIQRLTILVTLLKLNCFCLIVIRRAAIWSS